MFDKGQKQSSTLSCDSSYNFCATLSITIVIAFVFTTFYREINCNFVLFLCFFSRGSLRAFSDAADPR